MQFRNVTYCIHISFGFHKTVSVNDVRKIELIAFNILGTDFQTLM